MVLLLLLPPLLMLLLLLLLQLLLQFVLPPPPPLLLLLSLLLLLLPVMLLVLLLRVAHVAHVVALRRQDGPHLRVFPVIAIVSSVSGVRHSSGVRKSPGSTIVTWRCVQVMLKEVASAPATGVVTTVTTVEGRRGSLATRHGADPRNISASAWVEESRAHVGAVMTAVDPAGGSCLGVIRASPVDTPISDGTCGRGSGRGAPTESCGGRRTLGLIQRHQRSLLDVVEHPADKGKEDKI